MEWKRDFLLNKGKSERTADTKEKHTIVQIKVRNKENKKPPKISRKLYTDTQNNVLYVVKSKRAIVKHIKIKFKSITIIVIPITIIVIPITIIVLPITIRGTK